MDHDRLRHQHTEKQNLQATLESKYGVPPGPQADKLFALAWEDGHAFGNSEVEIIYQDLQELLPDWQAFQEDLIHLIASLGDGTTWEWINEQVENLITAYQ